ncbi:uncharacterized protein PWA37_001164 [Arxiozyma heterogenica]|uniref:uncharacterized protein n=1 Tax=Arxiozyma heterogenica TaxID=278026 RepID=UPI002F0CD9F0
MHKGRREGKGREREMEKGEKKGTTKKDERTGDQIVVFEKEKLDYLYRLEDRLKIAGNVVCSVCFLFVCVPSRTALIFCFLPLTVLLSFPFPFSFSPFALLCRFLPLSRLPLNKITQKNQLMLVTIFIFSFLLCLFYCAFSFVLFLLCFFFC